MTPKDYCYHQVAKPGSVLQITTRQLDSLSRDGIIAICAFYKEIEEVTLNWQDLNIAQTKLNWWRNQVIHLADLQTTQVTQQATQVTYSAADPLTPQANDVTASQANDVAASQANDVAASQANDVAASQANDVAASQANDVAASQANDVAASQAINEATHPVMQMLQKLLPASSLKPLQLMAIIDGLEQNLSIPHFETFEEIVVHVIRTAGAREYLIATLLQKKTSLPQEAIYQFALVIELVNYLQNCRRYLDKGLIFFAAQEQQQFHVTEAVLLGRETTNNISQLFAYQAEKIHRSYQKAMDSLSHDQKHEIANIIIRSEIALGTLKAIQSRGYCVLAQHIEINPLRCWWINWVGQARY